MFNVDLCRLRQLWASKDKKAKQCRDIRNTITDTIEELAAENRVKFLEFKDTAMLVITGWKKNIATLTIQRSKE